MAETFDPYHKWLGIPPKDQPPSHYRLLGIDLFESNVDVIADAADRQMAHLRTHQLGKHAELSQKLLNELAAARLCLLDIQKKAAYDAELGVLRTVEALESELAALERQDQLAAVAPCLGDGPAAPAAPEVSTNCTVCPPPCAEPPPAPPVVPMVRTRPRRATGNRKTNSSLLPVIGALLALSVIGLLVVSHLPPQVPPPQVPPPQVPPPVGPKPQQLPPRQRFNWRPVAATAGRTVVRLQTTNANGQSREGLAFVADPTSILITSAEVAEHCVSATAHFGNGSLETLQLPAMVDVRLGLAAFRIKAAAKPRVMSCALLPVPGSPLALCRPVPPDRVQVLPLELNRIVSRDEVLRRLGKPPETSARAQSGLDAGLWLDLNGAIRADDCGGPVLNASGQLVGLLVWSDATQTAHFAVPAGEIDGFLAKFRDPLVGPQSPAVPRPEGPAPGPEKPTPLPRPEKDAPAQGKKAADQSGEIAIVLPSGTKVSAETFAFDLGLWLQSLRENYATAESPIIALYYPDKSLYALACHKQGVLHGVTVTVFRSQAPQAYVSCLDGKRHGTMRTWDENGRRLYWCDYSKGKRHGLCCYFDEGVLRLLLECSQDEVKAVHVIEAGIVSKSFSTQTEAERDKVARPLLGKLSTLESEIAEDERRFKKAVKAEWEAIKKWRSQRLGPEVRKEIQDRINDRRREMDTFIGAIRRKVGGPSLNWGGAGGFGANPNPFGKPTANPK